MAGARWASGATRVAELPPGVGAGRSPLAGAGRSPAHLADRVGGALPAVSQHLADRVGGALPAVSQHLAKLKLAGLVPSRREGRRQVYYVDDPDIVTVVRVMVGQLTARETPSGTPPRLREAGV
ncbi:DNA-binding transcriptional ArsR family regulator [Streptomyces sp. SAI-135]|nr:DNA-binding transcriptional ArsR family regulator [Streptomyces sp. SAI-090]MDH6619234.1 DNA-binding transcriptional ArsR family regulator [Streptomyces sp. SAI-135]